MAPDSKPTYTTANGCPFHKPEGPPADGRTLALSDHHLVDTLAHFNREKIPERVVHAKGAGAYGEFEVTADISDICDIDMLVGVGKKTPCVTRFSTTGLERGSNEGMRDLKGMACKFYTTEGNWDWVMLNFPFFFIRDPVKFPSLMHAQRRDPQTNLLNPNMYWDWVTNNHESLHMVLLQFSDFGTMFNWRSMSGYMAHAYKWVKPDGSFKYVHIFLSSDRGPNFTDGQQAKGTNDLDPDHATRDLYEAIERGEYPTWTASVQVVDPKDAPNLGYNILDVTKHWNLGTYPKDVTLIPPKVFGKLTLKRNPANYFAEIEQLAYSPSNMVPGVAPSEDPILQARIFAYPDAQRYRLGANHQQIPVNRSAHTFNPIARDGQGTFDANYGAHPGFLTQQQPVRFAEPREPDPKYNEWLKEIQSKSWLQTTEHDYKFARDFYEVLPDFRGQEFQDTMVQNMVESVAQTRAEIQKQVYETWKLVSPALAARIQKGVETLLQKSEAPAEESFIPARL
ncbi:putative catalase Cat [Aspergillus indologenus CBS 114.80]|uniref:Putative catalase Cat n=1 Tax=Aspergillus indologenus CBS 114.80 TaxID=1450541 RepID=A0A2V5IY48_9EURO|nr:putative catalase Cat [Aspergillus indologenus CBS 114.80]